MPEVKRYGRLQLTSPAFLSPNRQTNSWTTGKDRHRERERDSSPKFIGNCPQYRNVSGEKEGSVRSSADWSQHDCSSPCLHSIAQSINVKDWVNINHLLRTAKRLASCSWCSFYRSTERRNIQEKGELHEKWWAVQAIQQKIASRLRGASQVDVLYGTVSVIAINGMHQIRFSVKAATPRDSQLMLSFSCFFSVTCQT